MSGEDRNLPEELSPTEIMAAYLMATGRYTQREIAKRLNCGENWLSATVKPKPEFQELVKQALRELTARVVASQMDIEELLNNEILPSIQTAMMVRDDPYEKGKTRLDAAFGILDRAPKAPKVTTKQESRHTILQIPVATTDGMREALEDLGEDEIVELLEGADFEEVTAGGGVEDDAPRGEDGTLIAEKVGE